MIGIKRKKENKLKMEKQLIIRGTSGEVRKIMESICKENKGKTIKQYLDKYSKDVMVLE